MGTCEPSTITEAADIPQCTKASWIGDGYCDALNNKEECLFDKGDCCIGSEDAHEWCSLDKPECACTNVGKFIFHLKEKNSKISMTLFCRQAPAIVMMGSTEMTVPSLPVPMIVLVWEHVILQQDYAHAMLDVPEMTVPSLPVRLYL